MYYHYGPMGGNHLGWGILICVLWLVFFIVMAFAVIRFMHGRDMPNAGESENNKPLDIVKQRYAKGEISKAEFDQYLKDLK